MAGPEVVYGCEHYSRKCQLKAPCCMKMYACRVCHDENEDHALLRHDVNEIMCLVCSTVQQVQNTCQKCGTTFGNYFCDICKLFDDKDKGQFHCYGCGICRIGGRANYFHCEKCDFCFNVNIRGYHKCIDRVSSNNCPVCLDSIHHSRDHVKVLLCGHLLHDKCFDGLEKQQCPVCNRDLR